jgi:hypothetical protein
MKKTLTSEEYIKQSERKRRSRKLIKDTTKKSLEERPVKKQEPLTGFMKYIKW